VWTRTYGGVEDDGGSSVQQTANGGYIIFGSSASFGGGWLLKTDSDGDTLWTRIYKGCAFSSGQQTSDGGYIITGLTTSYGGGLLLIKTDSLGYVGVEEPPVPATHPVTRRDWEVVTSVGTHITLRYENRPQGFHAKIYDATGRKVDEVHATGESGMITWGNNQASGVYFIRPTSGAKTSTLKVILYK
jgi:hypothetical protein